MQGCLGSSADTQSGHLELDMVQNRTAAHAQLNPAEIPNSTGDDNARWVCLASLAFPLRSKSQ